MVTGHSNNANTKVKKYKLNYLDGIDYTFLTQLGKNKNWDMARVQIDYDGSGFRPFWEE